MAIAINGTGTITGITSGGLPDGIVTQSDLATGLNTIQMVDGYFLTTSTATSSSDLLLSTNISKIEGAITAGTSIGSAMTNSSGTWSFPSVGKYLIYFQATFYDDVQQRYCDARIHMTTDNSNYNLSSRAYAIIYDDATNAYSTASCWHFVDVTDTAQVKVQFKVTTESAAYVRGAADTFQTGMYFIRLGET